MAGWAPLLDQRNYTPDGPEDCFETVLAMALQHLGHNVTVPDILAVHAGATNMETALALCARWLRGCYQTTGGFDNIDKLAITLFHDNGYANPDISGAFEHFGLVYAQDEFGVDMANPWGARDIRYPLSQFNPAYIGAIIVPASLNVATSPSPVPTPAPLPPPPPHIGGESMLSWESIDGSNRVDVFEINAGGSDLYHVTAMDGANWKEGTKLAGGGGWDRIVGVRHYKAGQMAAPYNVEHFLVLGISVNGGMSGARYGMDDTLLGDHIWPLNVGNYKL